MSSSSSGSFLMSVKELIETAFGDPEANTVNHKLIQTILLILARQLRMLERRVEVEITPVAYRPPGTRLSISEIKIHAMQKQKKNTGKDGGEKSRTGKEQKESTQTEQGRFEDSGARLGTGREEDYGKGGTGKTEREKTVGTAHSLSSRDKSTMDRTATTQSTSDKISSAHTDKSFIAKTTSGGNITSKITSDIISLIKTSMGKSSSEITSSDKTSSGDKTTTDQTSTEKSSTEKSSSGKTFSDKTSTDKTSSDKTSTDKTSTDKSSTDKTSTEKSSAEKTSSFKSSADKTSTETDNITFEDIATGKSLTSHQRSAIGSTVETRKLEEHHSLLETIEEMRERELRVIHQRTDSRVETDKTPTPMASLDSVEAQYEKLLLVERAPTDATKVRDGEKIGGSSRGRTPQLSVVTQEQFEELATAVRKLQERFAPIGEAGFPENIQLMQELRRGASLTDAMAALQLAARLEAAEKMLKQMMSIVTDLASQTPGIDMATPISRETRTTFGGPGINANIGKTKTVKHATETRQITPSTESSESVEVFKPLLAPPPLQEDEIVVEEERDTKGIPLDRVTYEELEIAMQELHDEILRHLTSITQRNTTNADSALKLARKLEIKLDESLGLGDRMSDLEKAVSDYAEQINVLDTGLTSQMTNYQEQLTQMQHELESGLDAMAEALANTGGDTVAVAELNGHFTNLQLDLDNMTLRQRDLKVNQQSLSLDLEALWKQIEILRETKSDRDEVTDALRDKAGISELNGLVSMQQFEAVRGDFEKRIGAAYDKFNNQEVVWQKAIDELMRDLNEKAEVIQVYSLKDDINKHLNELKSRLNAMLEIVGEPRAAAISRKLHRDAACLSCASPAHMALEEPGKVPALPGFHTARQPAVGAGAVSKSKGDGDHALCYPGLPIPHPRDQRSHVCNRYCGGSHTLLTSAPARAPTGMIISPAMKSTTVGPGTDGKIYHVDAPEKKPCLPCNAPKTPELLIREQEPMKEERYYTRSSDMTPPDFGPMSQVFAFDGEKSIGTPTPPIEQDENA